MPCTLCNQATKIFVFSTVKFLEVSNVKSFDNESVKFSVFFFVVILDSRCNFSLKKKKPSFHSSFFAQRNYHVELLPEEAFHFLPLGSTLVELSGILCKLSLYRQQQQSLEIELGADFSLLSKAATH